jgi:predicted nucleic acid-binding protein
MYLLDTNILSELIRKRPNPHLLSQLGSKPSRALFTSCICVMELRFGSVLREDFEVFWLRISKEIISRVNIVPLGEKEALVAGDILADMRKTGQSIGIEDVLIAASAITNRCIMVTANIGHFSGIAGLIVENWLESV